MDTHGDGDMPTGPCFCLEICPLTLSLSLSWVPISIPRWDSNRHGYPPVYAKKNLKREKLYIKKS